MPCRTRATTGFLNAADKEKPRPLRPGLVESRCRVLVVVAGVLHHPTDALVHGLEAFFDVLFAIEDICSLFANPLNQGVGLGNRRHVGDCDRYRLFEPGEEVPYRFVLVQERDPRGLTPCLD